MYKLHVKKTQEQVRIQRGIGGPDPPGKSQVILVSIEISIWTPVKKVGPPLENVGPPLDPSKV